MKSIASALSIMALGFGLLACSSSGGGGGSTTAFAVSTTSANFGVIGNVYTSTLTTTGGTAPFTWATGGGLPTGLVLDASTGVVSGTPTVDGNSTVIFTVTDSTGQTATGSVLFAIHPKTDLVSIDNGTPPVPGGVASSSPSISSNGRFVAFASSATFIPGVVGAQVYLHDWQTNQTTLVSRNAAGSSGNGGSSQPTINSNGQFVAFTSLATTLAATLGGSGTQIFLRDTQANTTTLVSQDTVGNAGNGGSSQPTINSNGQFVAFTSLATTLAATLGGSGTQIFLRDTQANTTTLVSQDTVGNAGNGGSSQPTINSNGQFVAFTSLATTLAAAPGGSGTQIFLRDIQANTTALVSQTAVGGNAGNGASSQPTMSANGGFAAFSSVSTNFGAAGGNQQIYVRALP